MRNVKINIISLMIVALLSVSSYSEELDTLAVINAIESDSLESIVSEYFYHTLEHMPVSPRIDTSYDFSGNTYAHYPVPFMTADMEMGDSSVLVVVDEITFQNISPYLMRYASDIYYGTNYDVYIERFVL